MISGKFLLLWASVLQGTLASPIAQTVQSALNADQAGLNPYPDKPRLVFRNDGTFKITVFSDLHYGENPWDWWGPEQDSNSTRVMKRVLKDETPDYVVINGDLITGENTFKENSTTLIDEIVAPLNAVKVPFSSTHGNHDNQVNITHAEEITRERQVAPLSYTRFSPPGIGGPGGSGNYWVPVYNKASDAAPSLILWFFDSRGGVDTTGKPGQDWVDESVARWLELETKTMETVWGPGEDRSALAFVHIPPHYIQPVQSTITPEKNPGLNVDILGGPGSDSVQSTFDPNEQDKDGPFWDSVNANVKNLFAVISGHDHGNEWCAREPTKDVVFCFDKHSGYGGYGDPSWGYGVRNIVFHPAKGKPKVESWIRLEEGETRAHVWLDDNLGR